MTIKCPTCSAVQPRHWDLLICFNCGDELGESQPDGEPVRRCAGVITNQNELHPAARQAIGFLKDGEKTV